MNTLISTPVVLTNYETEIREDKDANWRLKLKVPGLVLLASGVITMFCVLFALDYSVAIFFIPILCIVLGGAGYLVGSKIYLKDKETKDALKTKEWLENRNNNIERMISWANTENIILDNVMAEQLILHKEVLLHTGQKAILNKVSDNSFLLIEI
jgi:hypothetical protein